MDNGTPPLNTTTVVDITVLDMNDNTPVFNQHQYSGSVEENDQTYTEIVQVIATDADSGTNAEVHYIILSGHDGNFEIDSEYILICIVSTMVIQ